MKIEVGKEYKVLLSKLGFKKGDIISVVDEDVEDESRYCVVINRFENRRVSKFGLESMMLEGYQDDFSKNESIKTEVGSVEIKVGGAYKVLEDKFPIFHENSIFEVTGITSDFDKQEKESLVVWFTFASGPNRGENFEFDYEILQAIKMIRVYDEKHSKEHESIIKLGVGGARGMKIETGKKFRVTKENNGYEKGDCFEIIGLENDGRSVALRFLEVDVDGVKVTEDYRVLRNLSLEEIDGEQESSKPAHYDTAIDTIAFAKANFSREQVEGFMRINAIKYLQRNKGEKLSDLRKCAAYVQMLIELEEDGIE